jgi:hypothetical protein
VLAVHYNCVCVPPATMLHSPAFFFVALLLVTAIPHAPVC